MTTTEQTLTTLNNGVQIPALGFGVFQTAPENTIAAVTAALDDGYRLLDTAAAYGNEQEVGQAIRRSGIGRSEIFIETKLWISDYGAGRAQIGFDASLRRLAVDYVDMYLLHQPAPADFEGTIASYQVAEKMLQAGKTRAIGVCNFSPDHVRRLPGVLDGSIQPGRVFDRTISLDHTPDGYRAMGEREALKILIQP